MFHLLRSFHKKLDPCGSSSFSATHSHSLTTNIPFHFVIQVDFDFMDPPPAGALIRALETLYALAALNQQGQLTRLGRRMAELPLEPMLARCLLASAEWGCVRETVMVCGMLSAGAVFFRPKDRGTEADNAHRYVYTCARDLVSPSMLCSKPCFSC